MSARLDHWWQSSFRRLLDAEEIGGVCPTSLVSRWLALDQHIFPAVRRPRWTVGFDVPELVLHFLDDADVRAKDPAYAERQWAQAREWLNA